MGEPLDNYENVRDAVELLMDSKCFGLAKRRITISTVGVHNKFRHLAQDLPVKLCRHFHTLITPCLTGSKSGVLSACTDAGATKTDRPFGQSTEARQNHGGTGELPNDNPSAYLH